eukprot:TRINITY_DN5416_c0_g1_i2.p1 TRINITY_DN5416_c0_g1~~TRINITY_DN5416_c0_g1_i2.p1  ORF type:complete len:150 (+),score=46.90 TRINITY_DN5416_c0_g1_i2:395-844(+)
MARGVHISDGGEKIDLVNRLIKFGQKVFSAPPTPASTPAQEEPRSVSSKKRPAGFTQEDSAKKRRKIHNFKDIAPSIRIVFNNSQEGFAAPAVWGDQGPWKDVVCDGKERIGWIGEGTQEIVKVGENKLYNVKWKMVMEVLEEDPLKKD